MRIGLWLVLLSVACGSKTASVVERDMATTDAGAMTVGPSCLPKGYTVTPFLAATPAESFDQAEQVLVPGKDYVAVLETDVGCIALDLYEQETPITVNAFVFLALNHFFDGLAFHRVIEGFVAQSGDPLTRMSDRSQWGLGGPGYQFWVELVPTLNYDAAGVLGMARATDPNTNGSQFFITLAAAPSLSQKYTIFGKVTMGLDVLPMIVRGEPPPTPTLITAVTIATK